MKRLELLTVGYEGRTISEMVTLLKKHRVKHVFDIREIPISRKKGFSKRALQKALQDAKIHYEHYRVLGSPRTIRNTLRNDWNYEKFFKRYRKHLKSLDSEIKEKLTLLSRGRTCLLCFERLAKQCHRSAVVEKMQELARKPIFVEHLT